MSPPRVVSLMNATGIELLESKGAPSVGFEQSSRAYATGDGGVRMWVYELEGQQSLDRAITVIKESVAPPEGGRRVAFTQNGAWLMVTFYDRSERVMRRRANKLMSAFAGRVERPDDAAAS